MFFNTPLAITPEYLRHMASSLVDPLAVSTKKGSALTRNTQVRDGVAIIHLIGPISRYESFSTQFFGGVTVDSIVTDFEKALADPEIKSVILDVNSPGGEADGAAELSNHIFKRRGTKPVVAYADGLMASGAYWIGSAADEIVTSPTGILGSIGVVAQVADDKGFWEKVGVRLYEFVSSFAPKKRPDPGTESGASEIQKMIDGIEKVFIEGVARNRGVSTEVVAMKYGEGGVLVGKDAVTAGLADRIGDFESLVASLSRPSKETTPFGFQLGTNQSANTSTQEKKMTLEDFKATHPDLFKSVHDSTHSEGFAVGAQTERERIFGIEARRMPGHEALIEEMKRDGKTTPVEAGDRIAQAERERLSRIQASRKKDSDEIKSPVPQVVQNDSPLPESQILIHKAFGHSPEDIRKYLH